MRYELAAAVILTTLAAPAWAQTPVWSEAPQTQVWSEAPKTEVWSAPVYTKRRSDQDVQRQVDGIARDAERRAKSGFGAAPSMQRQDVPGQVWRDHVNRTRSQDQYQRDQDAYYERQRYHNPR